MLTKRKKINCLQFLLKSFINSFFYLMNKCQITQEIIKIRYDLASFTLLIYFLNYFKKNVVQYLFFLYLKFGKSIHLNFEKSIT